MSFKKYVENRDQDLPDAKPRNGLADPDPGELKQPHKPNSKDIDLAKRAIQLIMTRSEKWNRTLYRFLRRVGERIPDVGHIVDNMTRPSAYDKLYGVGLGKNDREPDVLSPSSADTSVDFYQK